MILLDTASTIFQVAIIYVLFHIVNLVGGGDASGALGGSDRSAQNYASAIGSRAGSTVGKSTNIMTQEKSNIRKNIVGGYGSKWTRGLAGKISDRFKKN